MKLLDGCESLLKGCRRYSTGFESYNCNKQEGLCPNCKNKVKGYLKALDSFVFMILTNEINPIDESLAIQINSIQDQMREAL